MNFELIVCDTHVDVHSSAYTSNKYEAKKKKKLKQTKSVYASLDWLLS